MENVAINLDCEIQNISSTEITIHGEKQAFDKVVIATEQNTTSQILELDLEGEERTTRTYIYKTKHNPIKKIANNAEF